MNDWVVLGQLQSIPNGFYNNNWEASTHQATGRTNEILTVQIIQWIGWYNFRSIELVLLNTFSCLVLVFVHCNKPNNHMTIFSVRPYSVMLFHQNKLSLHQCTIKDL